MRTVRGLHVCLVVTVLVIAVQHGVAQSAAPLPVGLDIMAELARPKAFRALRASSAKKVLTENGDSVPVEPGQTVVLGALTGPGAITHLWIFGHPLEPLQSNALVLRIYWDGAEDPSVEAPLGDFFGVGQGMSRDVDSAVVSVTGFGHSRNCFWNMPFQESARVTVTNESKDRRIGGLWYLLNWRQYEEPLPADTPYFHARYRQAFPTQPGENYVICDTVGSGHFAGTVLSVLHTDLGWFGEGDERFYVDGEAYPSLSGTGTEEYVGDAWGLREFMRPMFGVPMFEGYHPGDRASMYRWHLTDPIPFKQSLRMEIEHFGALRAPDLRWVKGFNERADWFSSVAFWYQYPPRTFEKRIPPFEERLPRYTVIPRDALTIRMTPEVPFWEEMYIPGVDGATIEYEFEVEEAGRYQVNAVMGHFFTGGTYQPAVDGENVGRPRDYSFRGEDMAWEGFDLHDLAAGKHTLRFTSVGTGREQRTLDPPHRALRLDWIVLLRLEDLEGYRSVHNRLLGGEE